MRLEGFEVTEMKNANYASRIIALLFTFALGVFTASIFVSRVTKIEQRPFHRHYCDGKKVKVRQNFSETEINAPNTGSANMQIRVEVDH